MKMRYVLGFCSPAILALSLPLIPKLSPMNESDLVILSLSIALIAVMGMGIVLYKHITFKRELMDLKADMKAHTLEHGIDDQLWDMFVKRTRIMLSFKR